VSRPLIVLDVVGLTPSLVGPKTPRLTALASRGDLRPLEAAFPAVTLSGQAGILTGLRPDTHGIVGNGWYWPELGEVLFWRQPHALLQAEDIPTRLRRERPGYRVAKLFFWFNMYAPVDYAVTPRPMYPADGRKVPDIHTHPPALRSELQNKFGAFPLFRFWGPGADLASTRWIADASIDLIRRELPDLSLVYLPHLDYDFQRFGPKDPRSELALAEVDRIVGEFVDLADTVGAEVLVVSEYGIDPVTTAVHPNRWLRQAGLLQVREELGTERLDPGASAAFAVADHQVAHVYVADPARVAAVAELFRSVPGIEQVLLGESLRKEGLAHPRSGQIVLVANADAWFTYYYWQDDRLAPDFARTVDIHRKPGYDPAELLFDPELARPKLKVGRRLIGRKLGFRNLLDVIGLDARVVRGSHGRRPDSPERGPVIIASRPLPGRAAVFPLSAVPGFIADLGS
jgi:predicted AlkP superfamily pyrophosphatase or phosphodiesterase